MRRRLLLFLCLPLAIAATVLGLVWFLRPQPRIDQATCDKIKDGMSERDVVDIIGAPAGDYGTGEILFERDFGIRAKYSYEKSWLGQTNAIYVYFDADGKVVYVAYNRFVRDSYFDWFLKVLHLRDRSTFDVVKVE